MTVIEQYIFLYIRVILDFIVDLFFIYLFISCKDQAKVEQYNKEEEIKKRENKHDDKHTRKLHRHRDEDTPRDRDRDRDRDKDSDKRRHKNKKEHRHRDDDDEDTFPESKRSRTRANEVDSYLQSDKRWGRGYFNFIK